MNDTDVKLEKRLCDAKSNEESEDERWGPWKEHTEHLLEQAEIFGAAKEVFDAAGARLLIILARIAGPKVFEEPDDQQTEPMSSAPD